MLVCCLLFICMRLVARQQTKLLWVRHVFGRMGKQIPETDLEPFPDSACVFLFCMLIGTACVCVLFLICRRDCASVATSELRRLRVAFGVGRGVCFPPILLLMCGICFIVGCFVVNPYF